MITLLHKQSFFYSNLFGKGEIELNYKRFILGPLQTNCYVAYNDEICYIIDPAFRDTSRVEKFIEENKIKIKGIMLTHGHIDHIEGAKTILEKYSDVKLYISEEDKEFLQKPVLNLSEWLYGENFIIEEKENIITFRDGDKIGKFEISIMPGHTRGSAVFYNKEDSVMITGDLIFMGSIGRTDFPTGNSKEMEKSLKKIMEFPLETKILPGHGPETSIEYEFNNNIYCKRK